MTKPFRERCSAEATRDAIFLFQSRRLILTAEPYGWEWSDDGLCMIESDASHSTEEEEKQFFEAEADRLLPYEDRKHIDKPYINCKDLWERDADEVLETWITESVWLSREEATHYGECRAYNYTDGWRGYCVCAEGELAKLIKNT